MADALTARGVSMRFGPRLVLQDFDLDVGAGEVHALLGANGSGKSTFVKIVSGNYVPTACAELRVGGEPVSLPTSVSAMQARGVRVVHQDLGLVDELSILENIALSRHYVRRAGSIIDWGATREAVRDALDVVGIERPVTTVVGELAAWERVGVVFARALYGSLETVRLLVLDEITAALPSQEVARAAQIVQRLTSLGAGVLYITHRFEEVFAIADRLTLLRDGRTVFTSACADTDPAELVSLVAGAPVHAPVARAEMAGAPVALQLRSVSNHRLKDVSLAVRRGEIVGVTGRAGCGRSALGRAVFGLEDTRGTIEVAGRPVAAGKPWKSLAAGVAYVGQDRVRGGSVYGASVSENFAVASLSALSRGGWLVNRRERSMAASLIESCDVRPPDPDAQIETLSGGNQQKVVVGRWLPRKPKVFVLDEPTEGVDVGARQGIYAIIREQAADGCAVLVLSSSIEELVELCDSVLVMAEGQVAAQLTGSDVSVESIENLLLYQQADPSPTTGEGQVSAAVNE